MKIRRDYNFIGLGRAFMLACIFTLASVMAQAQTDSEKKKVLLELKLSAPNTVLCAGTSIDLELETKNISQEIVKIDKADLWSQFFYSYSNPKGGGQGGGRASNCGDCYGDLIVLYPGDTYWGTYKFSLENEFFQRDGKYDIGTSINSVKSNKVEFELIKCGKTKSEVTQDEHKR